MTIRLNMKWKVKVDEKKYGSVDEMPPPIREEYEKAIGKVPSFEHRKTHGGAVTKIVFNGQEYSSIESMPAEERQRFESILKTAQTSVSSSEELAGVKIGSAFSDPEMNALTGSHIVPNPIAPETRLSFRKLIIGAALIGLLLGIYSLIQMGGFR